MLFYFISPGRKQLVCTDLRHTVLPVAEADHLPFDYNLATFGYIGLPTLAELCINNSE
ncbi:MULTISPECIES: hypothetical protein [unclassified Pedobacter]|uniref:hypothetical protein n=1 Tax=unclassified Pedobacter TaxID=2628915 RepID=UPI0014231503|nr:MULTISPECIES: hypothetical protein [unclassified Pedobacter]NII81047.1 hypothetical protein [Pedobacter sp. SG908]NMN35065.1 hypothetical protein [Pedobacter sp. SG918]